MGFSNRRNSTHRVPARETARVGWRQGSEFRCAPARLGDLTPGGAAVAVDESAPGAGAEAVWVCLAGLVMTGRVKARVAGTLTDDRGARRIRLALEWH